MNSTETQKETRLFNILRDDIGKVDFKRTLRDEFADLQQIMLTEERRTRLRQMNRFRRWLAVGWWMLKSMIRKFTPARRLMFVLGLAMTIVRIDTPDAQLDFHALGVTLIVFLLLLELKDKLVAHEELGAGRIVQQALMPERTPRVPGWQIWLFARSANEVGGDLIDFVRVDDNRYGIALGDVAGKGLSAALLSAKLQATLKAIIPDHTSLASLAAKLNRIYCRDGLKTMFASLGYLEVTADSGAVRFFNAGHLPPLLLRNGVVEIMKKGGPALGIVQNGSYEEQQLHLGINDVLVMYSDGVTEAQSISGEFFGDERVRTLLPRIAAYPAQLLGTTIIAELDRFIGEARATDDVSLVIVKRATPEVT